MRRTTVAAGCVATATTLLGLATWLAELTWRSLPTSPAATAPDVLLTLASAAAAVLAARLGGGAAVGTVVVLLHSPQRDRATGRRWDAERVALAITPRLGRPLLVLVLGIGLGVGAAASASATPGVGSAAGSVVTTTPADTTVPAPAIARGTGGADPSGAVAGGPHRQQPTGPPSDLPAAGWPAAAAGPAPTSTPPATASSPPAAAPSTASAVAATRTAPATGSVADAGLLAPGGQLRRHSERAVRAGDPDPHIVVVRRGDSLWSLAAQQLGPSATAAEIAATWPRWWAANRTVVGSDPDLLLPGTRLVVPRTDG